MLHKGNTAMSMGQADRGSVGNVRKSRKKCFRAKVLEPFYRGGELLQEGAYGSTVYFCTKRRKQFAAKVMSLSIYPDIEDKKVYERRSVQYDDHILQHVDKFNDRDIAIIITELCDGNVDQLIQCKKNKRKRERRSKEIKPIDPQNGTFLEQTGYLQHFKISNTEIMRQAVEGIKFLHHPNVGIVHGDIKPSNFLLFIHDAHGILVKVADFGFNRASHCESIAAGTPSFMAPEYCVEPGEEIVKTQEADIFSLGLTLFYIFTEGSHVYGDHPYERLSKIWRKETPAFNEGLPRDRDRNHVMEGVTDEHRITTCDMIRRMLKHEPNQRSTIQDVAKHPTFWDSRKKVKFYQDIYKKFERWKNEKTIARWEELNLGRYDGILTNDENSGSRVLPITEESFPRVCREAPSPHQVIFYPRRPLVDQLVKAIRHKSSHGNLTRKELEGLGLDKDDWNKFLDEFTGTVPQLLVHLYEKFRDIHVQDKHTYY